MLEGLRVGETIELERDIPAEWTIASLDPGLPAVFGTPAMILLMEMAAAQGMARFLPEGYISLGVEVSVRHLAATPVGERVRARATVIEVAGRLVKFEIEAHDSQQLIGTGTHIRSVVEVARFLRRLENRLPAAGKEPV